MTATLDHVRVWVFDLDNTLYPARADLFAQIDARMAAFIADTLQLDPIAARKVQKDYYLEYGATLTGLIARHDVSPEAFLHAVHDIDVSPVQPDPELAELIAALPGRKIVFTNGSQAHAERVTERLGMTGVFSDLFDIAAAGYQPKPQRAAFDRLVARHDFLGGEAAMFEDMARNLAPAAEMGFTTVLVRSDHDWSHEPEGARPTAAGETPDFVHHVTDCLKTFLRDLAKP